MTELELYIQSYFGVKQDSLKSLADLFKPSPLLKNEFFCESGKNCKQLSFIKSGSLRVFAYADGKAVTQWISSQGEFVTDLSSLIFNTAARWNIQALTDCELYTINKEDYDNIESVVPDWSELEKRFLSKCFLILEDRVFSFLSMSAEERYTVFIEQKLVLFNQVPHHYIASMLGMTPETLSRLRAKHQMKTIS